MKIIINGAAVEFKETESVIKGGQLSTSSIESVVYRNTTDNSLWRFKKNSVFQEYIGFTAYNALHVSTPKYDVGVIDDDEKEDPGSLIFLQEYIDITESNMIEILGEKLLSIDLDITVPFIIASVILGDTDGVGRVGDNVLLESTKKTGTPTRVFKIDCAKAFENLTSATKWLNGEEKHPFNSLFDEFIKKYKSNLIFNAAISKALSAINLEKLSEEIKASYDKFEHIVLSYKGVAKSCASYERIYHNKNKVGPIAFLKDKSINSIFGFTSLILKTINNLINKYQGQKDKKEEAKSSAEDTNNVPPAEFKSSGELADASTSTMLKLSNQAIKTASLPLDSTQSYVPVFAKSSRLFTPASINKNIDHDGIGMLDHRSVYLLPDT